MGAWRIKTFGGGFDPVAKAVDGAQASAGVQENIQVHREERRQQKGEHMPADVEKTPEWQAAKVMYFDHLKKLLKFFLSL